MVVVKQVVAVVGEIRLGDIGPAIIVVVGGIDAHPCLLSAIATEGNPGLRTYFGEPAFAITMVEHAGIGVVGDVQVETTIEIVVEPQNAEAIVRPGIDVEFFGHVRKSAISIVVVKAVAATLESPRSTGDGESAIGTKRTLTGFREMIQVEIDIVGDVEVEIAIVVVIAEGRAGAPAPRVADASFCGHIGKGAVAVVVIQNRAVEVGNVKVFMTIVIIVSHGDAESPTTVVESRL